MGKYINYFYDLLYPIMKKNPKTLNGQIFFEILEVSFVPNIYFSLVDSNKFTVSNTLYRD